MSTAALALAALAMLGCASEDHPARLEDSGPFAPGDPATFNPAPPPPDRGANRGGSEDTNPDAGGGVEQGGTGFDLDPNTGTGASGEGVDIIDPGQPGSGEAGPTGTGFGNGGSDENTGTGFDLTPNTGTGASNDGAAIENQGQPGVGQAGPTGTGFGNGDQSSAGARTGTDTGTTTSVPPTDTSSDAPALTGIISGSELAGEAGNGSL